MQLPDGTEALATLAVPLPLDTAAVLIRAIGEAANELGYRDVALLTDGSHTIVGRRVPR
jgi:hypothetical protein